MQPTASTSGMGPPAALALSAGESAGSAHPAAVFTASANAKDVVYDEAFLDVEDPLGDTLTWVAELASELSDR